MVPKTKTREYEQLGGKYEIKTFFKQIGEWWRPITTDESGTHLVMNCLLTTTLEKHLC